MGAGAIGCAAIAVAVSRGAEVLALVRSEERAQVAREAGAHPIIAAGDGAVAALRRAAGQVDGVIECTGVAALVPTALEVVRPGGRVVLYGVYRAPALLDLNLVAELKEIDVRGGHLAPHGAFGEAIRLLADGAVDGARLITHRHTLDDVLAALEPAVGPTRVKAVLEPNR
jgi:L-iditol 2-dehydrogenase